MYKIIQRLLQDIKNYYIGVLIFILYSIVVRHIFSCLLPTVNYYGDTMCRVWDDQSNILYSYRTLPKRDGFESGGSFVDHMVYAWGN